MAPPGGTRAGREAQSSSGDREQGETSEVDAVPHCGVIMENRPQGTAESRGHVMMWAA